MSDGTGRGDFDFFVGSWNSIQRRLTKPLSGFFVAVIALGTIVAWLVYEEIRWGDDSPVGLAKSIPRGEKSEQSRDDDRGES